MVTADDEGQGAGASGIDRSQSVLSGASVVTAASDEEDEGAVSISVLFYAYLVVCFAQ